MASGGSDCADEGGDGEDDGGIGGVGGVEGALMKAVRVLASRLVDLGNAPSASIG